MVESPNLDKAVVSTATYCSCFDGSTGPLPCISDLCCAPVHWSCPQRAACLPLSLHAIRTYTRMHQRDCILRLKKHMPLTQNVATEAIEAAEPTTRTPLWSLHPHRPGHDHADFEPCTCPPMQDAHVSFVAGLRATAWLQCSRLNTA